MTPYYDITIKIKDYFDQHKVINTTRLGDISKVDLNKQSIFPLAHLIVNNALYQENIIRFNISILLADLVDFSHENVVDDFNEAYFGKTNLHDVYNTLLVVGIEFLSHLKRGDLYNEYYQLDTDSVVLEPFEDRFENLLAGWAITFDITMPNNIGIC